MSQYKYFTADELRCRCGCGGGIDDMDAEFMDVMDMLRETLGFALPGTSGYRCPVYNARISSTGTDGPHTTGKAIDVAVDREQAYQLLALAIKFGFTGIGIQQKGSGRFIHLDVCKRRLKQTIWSY